MQAILRTQGIGLIALVAASALINTARAEETTITVRAYSGQVTPGDDLVFGREITLGAMGRDGVSYFYGDETVEVGIGAERNTLWSFSQRSGLARLLSTDDIVVGSSGQPSTQIQLLGGRMRESGGRLGFLAPVQNLSSQRFVQGLYVLDGHGAAFRAVALEEQPAPGIPGATLGKIRENFRVGRLGRTLFQSELFGAGINPDDTGIFLDNAGQISLVFQDGNAVTFRSIRDGVTVTTTEAGAPLLADDGVAFTALASNVTGWSGIASAVLHGDGSSQVVIAASNDQIPNLPQGITFLRPFASAINNSDQVLILSEIQGAPRGQRRGLWLGGDGGLQPVYQTGAALLDRPDLGLIEAFGRSFTDQLTDSGLTAFTVETNTGEALVVAGTETRRTIAASLDIAPGIPDAVFSDDFVFQESLIREDGTVVFDATLITPQGHMKAIYAGLPDGELRLLVISGQTIEVDDGDFRTIDRLTLIDTSGFGSHISDDGQIVFRVVFKDDTRATLTTTIPTPGVPVLLGSSLIVIGSRRRRRASHSTQPVNMDPPNKYASSAQTPEEE